MIRTYTERTYDGIQVRITKYLPPEEPEIIIKCYLPGDCGNGFICRLKGDEVFNTLVREKVDEMVSKIRRSKE